MGKTVKVTLIALALMLLLLLLLVLFVPESQWARNWVEDQASQRLDGREVEIADIAVDWGWPPIVRVEGVSVANPDWVEHEHMLELEALELVPEMGALLSGNMGLQRLDIEQPRVHLARRADGSSNWGELIGAEDDEPPVVPDVLTINGGQLTYQDEMLDASIEARVRTTTEGGSDRRLAITGEGRWEGKPLQFDAWGAAPLQVLDEDSSYPLMLEGNLGELQVHFDGQARDPLQPEVMQGVFAISAPDDAQVAALLGYSDLAAPAFELQGQVERDGPQWTFRDLDLQSDEANLQGEVTVVRGDPLRLDVELDADRIDLDRWNALERFNSDQEASAQEVDKPLAERLAKQFEMLRGRQIELALTVDELVYGGQSLDDLIVRASLDGKSIEVSELQASQGDGRFQASGSLMLEENDVVGEINVEPEQFHLGNALEPIWSSDLGVLDGDIHLRLREGVLTLHETEIAYDAPAQEFSIQLKADARQLPSEPVPGLHVEGSGFRNGEPFRFDLDLGPLLDLTAAQKPYPIKGMLASRESTLYIDGTIIRPLALESVDTQFKLAGPNPDRINEINQLSLPSLPPYHIEGRLRWHDGLLQLNDFSGGFGESLLSGDLRLRTGEQPMIWATLYSRTLDYDDLRPLWGSPPGTGPGEVASAEQIRLAREQEQDGQFFSDEPWSPDALRRMDAKVDLVADHVDAKGLPLQELKMQLELQNGRLTLQPLQFGLGEGTLDSYIRIDARQASVTGQIDASAKGVNLKSLLRDAFPDVARDSVGIIGGEADLSFSGISMAEFMAGAGGQLELAMSGGQLDVLAVELLGLDAGEALVAALVDTNQVPIRCAYVRLQAEEGQVDLEQLFMDTDDANFTGAGTINLRTEQIDMALESHPKDVSILTANSPVQLRGTLDNPQVEVTSTELLARGIASAIGLAVAPPLAILPWVDPGLGEGVGPGCRQVLDEFRSEQ
ncbi:AsmA family protein [Halopseudomonas sp.]|uniref:AsmA family protein n=1 Tax=Halopseudomonas sp. TaxID=2901191 RepID=UPI003567136A